MKKLTLSILFVLFTAISFAQQGDLTAGARVGYVTQFKGIVYGVKTAYHLSDPFELNLSFLMNPKIKMEATSNPKDINNSNLAMYSINLDTHYYILMQKTWAMAPIIGVQYAILNNDFYNNPIQGTQKTDFWAFNIGWQMRYNIGENLKLEGGWRYSAAGDSMSHHTFYLGLGYTFQLY